MLMLMTVPKDVDASDANRSCVLAGDHSANDDADELGTVPANDTTEWLSSRGTQKKYILCNYY